MQGNIPMILHITKAYCEVIITSDEKNPTSPNTLKRHQWGVQRSLAASKITLTFDP